MFIYIHTRSTLALTPIKFYIRRQKRTQFDIKKYF